MGQRIAYFVHNLADPAVLRRVRMFHAGGAEVVVLGFRRAEAAPASIDGAPTIDLGRTSDARFLQRILAVLRNVLRSRRLNVATRDADVVVARNLEMLALAVRLRNGRRLVYECLDIHRFLLESGLFARLVQALERALLKPVHLVLTSSPRFEIDYFRKRRRLQKPVLLLENKVLHLAERPAEVAVSRPVVAEDEPIVIGWFGMLRCRRTLQMLRSFAASSQRPVEILVAGIPSDAEFPDFAGEIAAAPKMTYVGPYRAEDLPALYARIHFIWAIDFFEDGLNSAWLLPNRLYEALDNGAVPLALRAVETGQWLLANRVGQVLDDPEAEVLPLLQSLTLEHYTQMSAAVAALPASKVRATRADCADLVHAIMGTNQK